MRPIFKKNKNIKKSRPLTSKILFYLIQSHKALPLRATHLNNKEFNTSVFSFTYGTIFERNTISSHRYDLDQKVNTQSEVGRQNLMLVTQCIHLYTCETYRLQFELMFIRQKTEFSLKIKTTPSPRITFRICEITYLTWCTDLHVLHPLIPILILRATQINRNTPMNICLTIISQYVQKHVVKYSQLFNTTYVIQLQNICIRIFYNCIGNDVL